MIKAVWPKLHKPLFAGLVLSLVAIIVAEIVLTVLIPTWRESFYNILQTKEESSFTTSLVWFFFLMTGLGFAQGLKVWVGQLVSFELRKAGTKTLFKTWVKGKRTAKNYTQAMTESLRNATELYLEVAVEILISAIIVISLIVANLHQHSILVAAFIYTITMSTLAALFNRPLIVSDKEWQSAEGKFREAIGDIANGNEDFSSKQKFLTIVQTYYAYIKIVMFFTLFSRVKSSLASLVPYILLAAPFFQGTLTLGDFMSGVAAFELIVINATIVIILYPKLTKARASYQLSNDFYNQVRKD